MRLNSFLAVLVLLLVGFIITSCSKKKERFDTSFSEDNALAENIFKNVSGIADEAYESGFKGLKSGSSYNTYLSECVDIMLDLTTDPFKLTVDFGENNCLCNDGSYRRGKILLTFNGGYHEAGTVITLSLENYFVDDNKVEGTMVLTNKGTNENGHIQYTVVVHGTIVKKDGGGSILFNSNRIREWVEGMNTYQISDDVYLISGTADGESSQGQSWEMITTRALRIELSCKWIVSGTLNIVAEGWPQALLDFGDGECDRVATVKIDGETYTIQMRN